MKNFVQVGDVITATASAGGVTSGIPVLIENAFGVPATSAAAGESYELAIEGVYDIPKAIGAINAAAAVYYDSSAGNVTTTAADNAFVGIATEAPLSSAPTVKVKLAGFALAVADLPASA